MGSNRRAPALAIALASMTIGLAAPARTTACFCAQTSAGWLLFEDSNWTTPDFWRLEEVAVQEITVCSHGIQFLFVEEEDDSPHFIALTFANPLMRPHASCTRDLTRALEKYAKLRATLDELFCGALERDGRVSFIENALAQRPRIIRPRSLLALEWRRCRVNLRGCLDVYMTLLP